MATLMKGRHTKLFCLGEGKKMQIGIVCSRGCYPLQILNLQKGRLLLQHFRMSRFGGLFFGVVETSSMPLWCATPLVVHEVFQKMA